MSVFRMLFEPADSIGTGGDSFQVSLLQILRQFAHQFPGDSLSSQRCIYKCVVNIHGILSAVCVRECNFRQKFVCLGVEGYLIFIVRKIHFQSSFLIYVTVHSAFLWLNCRIIITYLLIPSLFYTKNRLLSP